MDRHNDTSRRQDKMEYSTIAEKYLSRRIKNMPEYIPGEQPQSSDWIKLNTNESPYPPSENVIEAIKEALQMPVILKRYPHPMGEPLRSRLAQYWNLNTDHILVTNGSDEGLALILRCFLDENEKAAWPQISYSLYETLTMAVGAIPDKTQMCSYEGEPFGVDLDLLNESKALIKFLPNPNALTGEFQPTKKIRELIKNSESLWVIDEAYNDFAGPDSSMVPFISELPNCIIMRTFSKSHALAGMRIGYAVAGASLINAMAAVKDSYNEDILAIIAGHAAINDKSWADNLIRDVIGQRQILSEKLKSMGFKVLTSRGNFFMVRPPKSVSAKNLYKRLKAEKILIRYFSSPEMSDWVRISVGSASENEKLIEKIMEILLSAQS